MKKINLSMTRFVFITICLFISSVTFAGNKEDVLKKAIERGPTSSGSYVINASDGKPIKIYRIREYIYKKKGFYIVDYKEDNNQNMVQLEFVKTYDDYIKWMFYQLCESKPNTKTKAGKAFRVLVPNRQSGIITYTDKDYDNQYLGKSILHVNWTGEVVDGFIHGSGAGYFINKIEHYDNNLFGRSRYKGTTTTLTSIEGTYKYGFPASDCKYKVCTFKDDKSDARMLNNMVEAGMYKEVNPKMIEEALGHSSWSKEYLETLKTQANYFLANDGDSSVEKYLKEAQQLLKSGKTPVLSEDIIGKLGLIAPTRFFTANKESAQKRSAFLVLFDKDPKAFEALCYMDLFDGLYFASTENAEKAKKYVSSPNTFEYMHNSNYWEKMEQAQKAAIALLKMNSTKDIQTELISAQKTINKWGENIFAEYNKSLKKRNMAVNVFWGKVVDDLNSSSGSSSNSSTSSKSSGSSSHSIDIERITLSDFNYKFDGDWMETISPKRYVKFEDKEDSYGGYLFKTNGGDLYISTDGLNNFYYNNMENAIIALYVLKKYNKIRETGRK